MTYLVPVAQQDHFPISLLHECKLNKSHLCYCWNMQGYLLPSTKDVISAVVSSGCGIPLISQPNNPALILQLKVAVDPSVALIDVGVMMKAEIHMNQKITM